jgi:hypothetical protein
MLLSFMSPTYVNVKAHSPLEVDRGVTKPRFGCMGFAWGQLGLGLGLSQE